MRVFWASFLAVFIMVSAPHFIQKSSTFVSPVSEKSSKIDVLEAIEPKLQVIENNFSLKRAAGLIPVSYANNDSEILASAYGVIDFDNGEILFENNASKPLPIASITKIMTAVIVLDLASEDEFFIITKKAAETDPTKIGVVEGQKMSVEELLNAVLMTSANDAAQAISDGVDQKYGEEVFIKAMNLKAKYLSLKNTSFDNPQGFDGKNNYSSVEDLAVLSQYALKNYPLIAEIVKKEYEFLPEDKNHKQFDLYNWNGLLGVYPGAWGIKIGNTDNAGVTTIVVASRQGKNILVILLGTPGIKERDLFASKLLDMGFQKSLGIQPVNITKEQFFEKYKTWKYFN